MKSIRRIFRLMKVNWEFHRPISEGNQNAVQTPISQE